MLYSTQCTQVILGASGSGASGSSTISARLFVPVGTPVQARAGEISRPSQVWRAGIAPLCVNEGDMMISGITIPFFLRSTLDSGSHMQGALHRTVIALHPCHPNPLSRFLSGESLARAS